MDYLNFAVDLSQLPDGRYRISVSTPAGEASADVTNPFTEAEIADILTLLSGAARRSREDRVKDTLKPIGEKLFNFLFSDRRISNAYFGSLTRLNDNTGLRFKLSVDAAGLLSLLPWELLRDPDRGYLVVDNTTPLVRYTKQLVTRTITPIQLPLRVLVMISSPSDYPQLNVEKEWQTLQSATANLQKRGLVQLERVDDSTLTTLQSKLRGGVYHVFHFIGHSDYNKDADRGVLIFEDGGSPAKGQPISAEELSQRLKLERTLRLVVLNSCHSGRTINDDPFRGITSSIIASEIPAVVSMQFEITDGAAIVFAREFYGALAEFLPIDMAVSEARLAISGEIRNSEWVTPVLYMRSPDGHIFSRQGTHGADTSPNRSTSGGVLPSTPSIHPPPGTLGQSVEKPLIERLRDNRWIVGGIALISLVLLALLIAPLLNGDTPDPTATTVFTDTPSLVTPTSDTVVTTDPNALPNLVLGRIRVVPSEPIPGQFFRVNVTITNAGIADTGAFNWSWDASQDQQPIQLNSATGSVDNIPPGSSKTVSFPFLYGWWGTYTTLFQVDLEGQVRESNELDNRRPFPITLSNQPFGIDFTVLPDNSTVEPPITVGSDLFDPWRLDFLPALEVGDPCLAAPLMLTEIESDAGPDIVLSIHDDICANSPLSVRIVRGFVSDAQVVLLPAAAGEATVTYFSDLNGTLQIGQTPPTPLNPNAVVTIGGLGESAQIRRIDITSAGQPVRLTRLILFPPPQ